MRHYTNAELKQILVNLENGTDYCAIDNGCGIGRIQYCIDYNCKPYINYRYYGQSAIKPNLKELRWLIETIFTECECITEAIWSDYHINYVPISRQYKAIDCSMQHPNVCGL